MIDKKFNVLYVIGTRPEVISSAMILKEFEKFENISVKVLNTMQHYDRSMMGDLISELNLPPIDFSFEIDTSPSTIRFSSLILNTVRILLEESFDAVIVYGDTDSSLAAALAAIKCSVRVIHIEAGCRSGDSRMQEEKNRRAIDQISDLLLSVSDYSTSNLSNEKVLGKVFNTGDPQYDVFLKSKPHSSVKLARSLDCLVTLHRSENVDNSKFIEEVISEFRSLNERFGLTFSWSVHPRISDFLSGFVLENDLQGIVNFISPMTYAETLLKLSSVQFCITDSGGLQKEAYWLETPCITVRPSTEWYETVELRANTLAISASDVFDKVSNIMNKLNEEPQWGHNPYGDKGSSYRVVEAISQWFREEPTNIHDMNRLTL